MLNPHYTFETFRPCFGNQFALAAAKEIAKKPGKSYNPVLYYGNSGLGKTHLLHAIGNKVLQNNNSAQVACLSSKQLVEEFVSHVQVSRLKEFQQMYLQLEVLLIDEIDFLIGKRSIQESFRHLFTLMVFQGRQIVLAGACVEVGEFLGPIYSRFEWGLITDIK
jgi:chromosomal replication initiator protein